MVYFQWANMIANLPVNWLPSQVSKHGEGISNFSLLSLGSSLSVDCFFQAWNLWSRAKGADADPSTIAVSVLMRVLTR